MELILFVGNYNIQRGWTDENTYHDKSIADDMKEMVKFCCDTSQHGFNGHIVCSVLQHAT